MIQQPVSDIGITYAPSTTAGAVVVDLTLSPAGDVQLVTGKARLAQDMTRFLSTPQGSHFSDPSYGSSLWSMIGRPQEASDEVYTSAVEDLENSFLHMQSVAAAQGYLDVGATLAIITDTQVDRSAPGQIAVRFVAHTRSGDSVQASAPLGG